MSLLFTGFIIYFSYGVWNSTERFPESSYRDLEESEDDGIEQRPRSNDENDHIKETRNYDAIN